MRAHWSHAVSGTSRNCIIGCRCKCDIFPQPTTVARLPTTKFSRSGWRQMGWVATVSTKKNNVHWKKLSSNILHLHYHLFEVFFYNCHCWSKWFHLNLSFHSIAILLAAVHSFVFTCVIQWCFQNHQCNVMMIMTMFVIRMNHDMRDDMVYNGGRTKTGRRTIRIGRCIVFPEPNRSSAQKNSISKLHCY